MKYSNSSSGNVYNNISFVYDPRRGAFIHVDEGFKDFTHHDLQKITPALGLSMVHSEDRDYVEAKFQEFIGGQLSGSVEFRVELQGKIHWVRLTPVLMNVNGTELIAATITDITAETNNFASIRRYANKKNSILNMLAHDLRGPLEIARTLVKDLDKKLDDPVLIRKTQSVSGILSKSIDLIVSLIDRELLETAEVELFMKRVDIVMKVGEYIEECKRSQNATGRVFNFSSKQDSIYMSLDEAKFMQVLNNLTSNALKFTHPGGIISVGISEENDCVLLTFSDNGIGIPQSLHERLFEEFTASRRTGLNGEPTTGLGLSIVKMIVEWHKGKIRVESDEGRGTTFFVELPKGVN